MSLRGFHIVFITLATLMAMFLAVWAFGFAPSDAGVAAPVLGIIGVIGAIGLPIYGVYFYRKAKNIIV